MGWQDDHAVQGWRQDPPVNPLPTRDQLIHNAITPNVVLPQIGQGVADVENGAAQFAAHLLPTPLAHAGHVLYNKLAQFWGLPALPPGGIDQAVKNENTAYENWRRGQGLRGPDVYRAIGNTVPFLAGVGDVPESASLLERIAQGSGMGTLMGSLQPVTQGNFAQQKAEQMGLGAATGGITGGIGEGVSKAIAPTVKPAVKTLMGEGVTPTVGQIVGGPLHRLEDAATSIPLLGDAIKNAQRRAVIDLNRAAINRSLVPIGKTLPPKIVGNSAIDYASSQLSDAYDTLLPKLTVKPDKQFTADISQIERSATNLPPDQKQQFSTILQNEVLGHFQKVGKSFKPMSGEEMKNVDSELGRLSRGYRSSANYSERGLGDALQDVQSALRGLVERSNPKYAPQLQKINQGYANFLRVQNAAARQGSKEGIFSAPQLRAAVRATDATRNKSAFARGHARMQDLSTSGENVLGSTVPDSGTIGRALTGGAVLGEFGHYVSPGGAVGAGLSILPYTTQGQRLAAALLTKRPNAAPALAKALRKRLPLINPGLLSLESQ